VHYFSDGTSLLDSHAAVRGFCVLQPKESTKEQLCQRCLRDPRQGFASARIKKVRSKGEVAQLGRQRGSVVSGVRLCLGNKIVQRQGLIRGVTVRRGPARTIVAQPD